MARTVNSFISVALLSAAAGCFLLGAGVTVTDVLLRALLRSNLPAAIELTSFTIGLGALLSMPACYVSRTHVTARLLSELMPDRFGGVLGVLGTLASVLFAGVLVWVVGANALSKLGSSETSRDLGLSMPVLLWVVTTTLAVALIAAMVGLWREVKRARSQS